MAQQTETASIEANESDLADESSTVQIPTSPASLWTSVSKVHYSVTHTGECDDAALISCDCVVRTD
ncbi:hypothetical protein GCM10027447_25190 [Glycomyces halotolerans]